MKFYVNWNKCYIVTLYKVYICGYKGSYNQDLIRI